MLLAKNCNMANRFFHKFSTEYWFWGEKEGYELSKSDIYTRRLLLSTHCGERMWRILHTGVGAMGRYRRGRGSYCRKCGYLRSSVEGLARY